MCLAGSKVDPYLEQLKLLSTTLSYSQTKGKYNQDLCDTVYVQILATQRQYGVFVFGDNYHPKVLSDDENFILKDFSSDQTNTNKYDKAAQERVAFRLIINNSLSSKSCPYIKDKLVVNQSNYSNTVVKAVTIITLFRSDVGDGGNNNTHKIPKKLYLSTSQITATNVLNTTVMVQLYHLNLQ